MKAGYNGSDSQNWNYKGKEWEVRVAFSCVKERKFSVLNTTISYFN